VGGYELDAPGSGEGSVAGCYENGNKNLGSISGKFLDQQLTECLRNKSVIVRHLL
jgi:hypothetical protein